MEFDSTFWVAISFLLFLILLIYFKIPQKVNELLSNIIVDIKKEIDESEKLREESKSLLDKAQAKLDTSDSESKKIIKEAKKDAENLIIEMNDKFHKNMEIKKKLAQNKIVQMKDGAIKEIRNTSIKIAVESVKKVISSSVDKSKIDALFEKKLEETKSELKKINS